METIGKRLTRLRCAAGYKTPADLAEKAELDPSYVWRLETGKVRAPAIDIMLRLAGALGVSVGELAGENHVPTENDLSPETRLMVTRLRPHFRAQLDQLLEQGAQLADTPEDLAAFEVAIRAACDSLELVLRRRQERDKT